MLWEGEQVMVVVSLSRGRPHFLSFQSSLKIFTEILNVHTLIFLIYIYIYNTPPCQWCTRFQHLEIDVLVAQLVHLTLLKRRYHNKCPSTSFSNAIPSGFYLPIQVDLRLNKSPRSSQGRPQRGPSFSWRAGCRDREEVWDSGLGYGRIVGCFFFYKFTLLKSIYTVMGHMNRMETRSITPSSVSVSGGVHWSRGGLYT